MVTESQRRAVFQKCTRFLPGHGRRPPNEILAALAGEARETDDADTYGEGETLSAFEHEIAALLGKPAALFLPSGTMAQQIALRIHAEHHRCKTVLFHPTCHLELWEQKGYERLHGLHGRLCGDPRRVIRLDDLRPVVEPFAALLLELPQREIGGQLPSWEELTAQVAWARERGAAVHMDGARLWESVPFYARPAAEIAALFDTVYVSFYKGLGALAGAALAGPPEFIAEARIWQRRHGGNLVTLLPFVLSARAGLHERIGRFEAYRQRAQSIARILAAIPGVRVKPDPPHTNMMHVCLPGEPDALFERALGIADRTRVWLAGRVRAPEVPGQSLLELYVGDGATSITDAEVDELFRELVR
jgi:threonine aldolase